MSKPKKRLLYKLVEQGGSVYYYEATNEGNARTLHKRATRANRPAKVELIRENAK